VTRWIDRLDHVSCRLHAHATLHRFDGWTRPDPGGDERWDAGQIWAHLAELGRYWLDQLDLVIDHRGPGPVAFGRTKADPARVGAIEGGRDRDRTVQYDAVCRAIDGLRSRLLELTADDWTRVGHHETLGALTIADQLRHFHVGHYEEHADQLDELVVAR
jgi:hypothetical protein